MGFHKRRINQELVLLTYNNSGIEGIKKLYNADALFLNDELSRKVYELLIDGNILKITNIIKHKIKNKLNMKNIITLALLFVTALGYSQMLDYPQKIDLDNQIIKHKAYVLSYNETCEQANWVKYMITNADLDTIKAKRKNNFTEDNSIPSGSASLNDYAKSGYDRGHLAPAASFVDDQNKMDESFLMSNMSPQDQSFNRGIWKNIEIYERTLAIEYDTLYIITGGILNKNLKTIGTNEVCVPEFYYKIIYNDKFNISFLVKNEKSSEPLYMFKCSIEAIEQLSNIKFKL